MEISIGVYNALAFPQKRGASMKSLHYRPATEKDLPFLAQVYQQNIVALHGAVRSLEDWKSLFARKNHTHYIVSTEEPVAWSILAAQGDKWDCLSLPC